MQVSSSYLLLSVSIQFEFGYDNSIIFNEKSSYLVK
jgi:hypothetical protein